MKTRGCRLIRLYSPDHFKGPTLESERGQTVIKLPLSLPYDGETSVTLQWKDFKTAIKKLAWDIKRKEGGGRMGPLKGGKSSKESSFVQPINEHCRGATTNYFPNQPTNQLI